ncbi:MAG: hypothetical protein J0I06_24245 [Planctomycetes bacterium]|nr:hypothetical protein [Planctomycetota bacterium]
MSLLHVERVGGLAGFGGPGAHVRSRGQLDPDDLSAEERHAVEVLFKTRGRAKGAQTPDAFHYRISRTTAAGTETVEVPESAVPTALVRCVKDELV